MAVKRHQNKRITQKDIALSAGVSQFAVSMVLSGGEGARRFSASTREKILDVAASSGYRPSHAAQALRTGVSKTVGLWMVRTHLPAHAIYSYYLHRLARLHHRQILLSETTDAADDIQDVDSWEWPVDAVIAVDSADRVKQFREVYGEVSNIVSAGWFYTDTVDHVGIDLTSGAKAAMDHILSSGCRDIVFLARNVICQMGEARYAEYTKRLNDENLPLHVVTTSAESRDRAYQAMKAYIAQGGVVDAVFAATEPEAIGAYRALREAGRRIPDDVILVAFGDEEDDLPYFDTPITGVAAPIAKICEIAWEYLQNRIQDPSIPLQRCVLPMTLNIRASSTPSSQSGTSNK